MRFEQPFEQSQVHKNEREDLQKELMHKGAELMETEEVKKQVELFEKIYGRQIKLEVVAISTIPSIEIRDKEFDITENKGLLGQVHVEENTTLNDVIAEMANIRMTIENYKNVMQDVEKK